MPMKLSLILLSSSACAALLGCQSAPPITDDAAPPAPWVGEAVRSAAVERAIVVQHTLYAYHFVEGAAELNALGAKDFAILAAHFREHAGELNVRRANAPAPLFDARVAEVTRALAKSGVPDGRVRVGDGLPGGDGVTSERVIEILSKPSTPLTDFGSSVGSSVGAAASGITNAGGSGQ
jgi:hypothetical protein